LIHLNAQSSRWPAALPSGIVASLRRGEVGLEGRLLIRQGDVVPVDATVADA
jgi:hypothetical protein